MQQKLILLSAKASVMFIQIYGELLVNNARCILQMYVTVSASIIPEKKLVKQLLDAGNSNTRLTEALIGVSFFGELPTTAKRFIAEANLKNLTKKSVKTLIHQ